MESDQIRLRPIGRIHSPHRDPHKTPIQPVWARGIAGRVEVFETFAPGLEDLEGFSHIHLLYYFDRADGECLRVTPYLEDRERGVFATRAPSRPNRIGLSLVRLIAREGRILHVEDLDVLDGTPLLDIKPVIARCDLREDVRSGWQDAIDEKRATRRGRRQEPC
ncbi:MAG: tRNA (N6-threonylcarbamoyladenosine(37)-N6)-methyltransferase TrmO [Candidatus Eisenbacteria bacterium]|nr:tRNA (N6-threonylcarbamoyladenosine(37)-N6)-methyltransferase TrmO [Candidatus Eisenbacteria bacterium]